MGLEVLNNRRAPGLTVFDEDFNEIAGLFAPIMREGNWSALPGGITDTWVPSAHSYPPLTLAADEFRGYRMDTGDNIQAQKHIISRALCQVEARPLEDADYTLCPSTTTGLLMALLALRRSGVRMLVVELPAYFGSIEQALALGFNVKLWPTIPDERFVMSAGDVTELRRLLSGPIALLVTQPRYGMGFSRRVDEIGALRAALAQGDVLIVDEAADQTVPAPLATLDLAGPVSMVRVRGLLKGLGLNSAKVAAIFHPPDARPLYSELAEVVGGGLDAASLKLAISLFDDPARYIGLLRAAQEYVRGLNELLGRLLAGLPVKLSDMQSGYIGTAHITFSRARTEFSDCRRFFLEACLEHRMPVVLGSSMYFPYSRDGEIIRINYFTAADNIRASASAIGAVVGTMQRRFLSIS